jgi:transketolase
MTDQIIQLSEPAATRDGFGAGLVEAAKQNPLIYGLCADLTESMRLNQFEQLFPERFVQLGVAEQNLIGVAAGLALAGKIPFAASFAVFSPGRSWDQIRVSIAYSNLNVKIVGGHTGLTTGPDGATHQALEDIACMRVLPNMTVVVPCDARQAYLATLALASHVGPSYLRLSRPVNPSISDDVPFTIGTAQLLKQGADATVIACGETVNQAIKASIQLATDNISLRVINMHTIKPIDKQAIILAANETGVIITAEDHQLMGGLGSAVTEVIAQELNKLISPKLLFEMVGVHDTFGESGSAMELMKKYQLDASAIVKITKKMLKKKGLMGL